MTKKRKVQKILESNDISFIKQYTPEFFKEKKSYSYQKCDFFIENSETVIECQGGQHFNVVKNLDKENSLQRRIGYPKEKKTRISQHKGFIYHKQINFY